MKFISFPYVQITLSFLYGQIAFSLCQHREMDPFNVNGGQKQIQKKKKTQKVTFFKIQLNPIAFLPRMFTFFSPKQWLI